MYICICNGLRERDVKSVASCQQNICAEDIMQQLGFQPQCGKCLCAMEAYVGSSAALSHHV